MIVVNEIALTVVLFILAGTVVGWYWMMWDAVKHLRKHNHEAAAVSETMTLACPFCGCEKIEVVEGSTFRWRVAQCQGCGAQTGEVRCQTLGEGTRDEWEAQARKGAMAEWNTRAVNDLPEPPAERGEG